MCVIQPGLFTTVQDLGRIGFASIGVPRSGAADTVSLRAGNRLVGNDDSAAGIEMTLQGGEFEFDHNAIVALTGASTPAKIEGSARPAREAAPWRAITIASGERLIVGAIHGGARAYLCVRGGVDAPVMLGSRSSFEAGGLGLFDGQALRAGDVMGLLPAAACEPAGLPEPALAFAQRAIARRKIHVARGPQAQHAAAAAFEALLEAVWIVEEHADRRGVRLTRDDKTSGGTAPRRTPPIARSEWIPPGRMITEPMPPGAVQVTPDGGPILLMPDGPPTGGYPVVACVALCDLPAVGQARPRDHVRFVEVSLDRARAALARRERMFAGSIAVDLNCDLGEEPAALARDLALLEHVTSVNIACGGHAGDERTMRAIARAAKAHGVAIGAHPGFPDRANFGRVDMRMSPMDLERSVESQIVALARLAREERAIVTHVKPHGALYHAAGARAEIADAIGRAARRAAEGAMLVGMRGSAALDVWRAGGARVLAEDFADRRYEPDGSLRARSKPGALIESPAEAAAQAVRLARLVEEWDAGTICVHSDTPGAAAIAAAVHAALAEAGYRVGSAADI